jgi:hypothetical protein
LREPGCPPILLARPGSKFARVFELNPNDINHVYGASGIQPLTYTARRWRPSWRVNELLHSANSLFQRPPTFILDLTSYKVIGRRLAPGLGLVSRDFCIVLIQEYGRWPGEPQYIAGRAFSWNGDRLVNVKIPIQFVGLPGAQEEVEDDDVMVLVEWQSEEEGIRRGPKVTALLPWEEEDPGSNLLNPL